MYKLSIITKFDYDGYLIYFMKNYILIKNKTNLFLIIIWYFVLSFISTFKFVDINF